MTNSVKKQKTKKKPHDVFTVLYQVVCVLCQSQKEERKKQIYVMKYQQWFFSVQTDDIFQSIYCFLFACMFAYLKLCVYNL